MSNLEKLTVTVDTITEVKPNTKILDNDAFFLDIEKRLDNKKALLITDATKLIDNDLSSFFDEVNSQVMKDVGLQVLQSDLNDGEYALYYTDSEGNQKILSERVEPNETVKETEVIRGMFATVLAWMLATKMSILSELKDK